MAVTAPGRALAMAAALAASGCTLGPDHHRPEVASPSIWSPTAPDVSGRFALTPVQPDWWRTFDDPMLTSLVQRLTARNIDLQVAAEAIEQARAQRRITGAQGLPQIGAQGGYMRNRISRNGIVQLLTPGTPGGANEIPSGSAPLDFDLFNAAGTASWELDLFGRVRRSVEAAGADLDAVREARSSVALALVSELALDYLELRSTQAQERLARETLAAAQQREALIEQRVREGAASQPDLVGAQAETQGVRASLPALAARQANLVNAIGFLLAEQPQALQAELAGPGRPTDVPAIVALGLPSDLILRRPDVREAEARLHAATARIGVARAAFYPSVTLFGLGGLQSLSGSDFFEWASRTFAVGPSVSLPIFQGGKLKGQLALANSQQREAALRFRSTVLQAWREVDDAVANYVSAERAQVDADATAKSRQRALGYALEQRHEGAIGDIEVIQARTAALAAAGSLVEADAKVRANLVGLYKSLGGGWEPIVAAAPGAGKGGAP